MGLDIFVYKVLEPDPNNDSWMNIKRFSVRHV
jgi:hypothetical protein